MDGTHFLFGAKIGSAKMIFPIIILNGTGADQKTTSEEAFDIAELGLTCLVFNAILGYMNYRSEKKLLEKWRSDILPALLQKQDQTILMLKSKAKELQKQVRQKYGIVIMRAYYGLKEDIMTYIDLKLNQIDSLYWEDDETRENLGNLKMINVTVPVRYNLDAKKGGLSLGADEQTKQFNIGFFNPIPEYMSEGNQPVLYMIFKVKNEEDKYVTYRQFYEDMEKIEIYNNSK